ncbi:MAG: hypothetical protein J7621_07420, partial [Niastella sp.]|nr:hypothetical protein [Niastella sp.]
MNKQNKFLVSISFALLVIAGCGEKDAQLPETAPVINGIESEYYVVVKQSLQISPTIENNVDSLVWLINGQRVANAKQYTFQASADPGTYNLIVRAYNLGNIVQKVVKITTGRYINWITTTNKILVLEASQKFAGKTNVKWTVLSAPADRHRLSDANTTALFSAVDKGAYQVKVSSGDLIDTLLVTVQQSDKAQTAYITKVFDYLPAPGQFVNELPKYNPG